MANNVTLLNISRRKHRIGTTTLPAYIQTSSGSDTTVSAPVTIDISTLDRVSRRQLMELIANGSVVSASALNSIGVVSIDQGSRSRNRIGPIGTADLTQTTFDGTALTGYQRRDLIQGLQSGSYMAVHGTRAATVYNLSSKKVRIGLTSISPMRLAGGFNSTDVITLSGTGGAYTFKLTYNGVEGATVFTKATNVTAAAIQAALRTATGDGGLTVTGTTDTGPFTVTYSDGFQPASGISVTSPTGGVSGTDVLTNGAPAAFQIADVSLLSQAQRRDLQLALAAGDVLVV